MNDIRGKVGTELLLDEVYPLAQATAVYFKRMDPELTTVVIARDGRVHSLAIEQELARGLLDSGLDVVLLGICPTPVVYFALHNLPVQAGIMITASHNGPEYNGLKINLGLDPVWGAALQDLYQLYKARKTLPSAVPGTCSTNYGFIDQYVDFLVNSFTHLKGMPLPLVIDCGNGATGPVLTKLQEKMNWPQTQIMYAEVDGTFPNHEADPTVEENMRHLGAAVIKTAAVGGIGFDGDGDRVAALTHTTQLLRGDQLLILYAQQLLTEHTAQSPTIIYDIKCSQIVTSLLASTATLHMSPSGRAIIKAAVRTKKAVLAGELSGHYFFADRYFGYDDGIYAFLRLVELLLKTGKSLHDLVTALPTTYITPEVRIECEEQRKEQLVAQVHAYFAATVGTEISLLDGVRVQRGDSWALVRASNTQAVVCIRTESATAAGLADLQAELCQSLLGFVEPEYLMRELQK